MKIRTFCSLLLLFLLSTQFSVIAQTHRGSIRGSLVDKSAPLANAPITITNIETNESRTASTGDQGEFTVSSLPPGRYRIEVEKTGYKKYSRVASLQVNQDLRIDITLEVGPITEELVINAEQTPLKKDTQALGTVIENRQITNLPLDGRNFLELSLLVPGAVPSDRKSVV